LWAIAAVFPSNSAVSRIACAIALRLRLIPPRSGRFAAVATDQLLSFLLFCFFAWALEIFAARSLDMPFSLSAS
jgi:hypothetical protein